VNYTENSKKAPIGAHVTIQTANGVVDVHLGPAPYLQSKHFSLTAGESVIFSGANAKVNGNSVFLARTAQKNNQVIAIRSDRGFLLATTGARVLTQTEHSQIKNQGRPQ